MADLGIRRENVRGERRAPLAPLHVEELVREHGRSVVVQPSTLRVFDEDTYRAAGAEVREDLSDCRVILGIKEIPPQEILPGKPHLAFFHVVKGQRHNMPILRRALEARATLIDYEPVVDRHGRRLLFFGRHAGYAGMIDGLWALGRRLAAEGVPSPLAEVRQAKDYDHLEAARDHLATRVGRAIREEGMPEAVRPLVIGFTGGGNVSSGAQEVLSRLPVVEVHPEELAGLADRPDLSRRTLYKVVFRRGHRADFARHLPHLTLLVNAIYWAPSDPRLVTWEDLEALWDGSGAPGGSPGHPPKLKVIADLSCDIEGSIEANVRQTSPDDPVYVAQPETRSVRSGFDGRGPVILAIGNLPAELPRDATDYFGDSLFPFVLPLAAAEYDVSFEHLVLPAAVLGAVITHRGELAPRHRHLETFLEAVSA